MERLWIFDVSAGFPAPAIANHVDPDDDAERVTGRVDVVGVPAELPAGTPVRGVELSGDPASGGVVQVVSGRVEKLQGRRELEELQRQIDAALPELLALLVAELVELAAPLSGRGQRLRVLLDALLPSLLAQDAPDLAALQAAIEERKRLEDLDPIVVRRGAR